MLNWIPKILLALSIIAFALLLIDIKIKWLIFVVPALFVITAIFALIYRKDYTNQLIFYITIGVIIGMVTFSF